MLGGRDLAERAVPELFVSMLRSMCCGTSFLPTRSMMSSSLFSATTVELGLDFSVACGNESSMPRSWANETVEGCSSTGTGTECAAICFLVSVTALSWELATRMRNGTFGRDVAIAC